VLYFRSSISFCMQDLYSRFGASSGKEDVHAAIQNLDKGIAPGAFCKVLPDILGKDADFLNVMHADGAGTKSILAYLYWRETGDLSVWKGIAQDSIVMNLDDLLCVGATTDFVITSTLGRNKRLIPGEVIKAIIEGTEEFCETMRSMGVNIYFAGGETADVGDLVKTVIVDSNISCRFPKKNLIIASKIEEGDVILGLASDGQTSYQSTPNSGIASNGITLARHILLSEFYSDQYPESIDAHFSQSGGYKGPFRLQDAPISGFQNLGQALLSPTRTFAPVVKKLLEETDQKEISGLIHSTGGGHSKVKNFIGNVTVNKTVNWEVPEVFRLIQREAGIDDPELFKTFNCGVRMEVYCKPGAAEKIEQICQIYELSTYRIGSVTKSVAPEVKIQSGDQKWSY
jgi:phosphoribosylformylglycinamidine cyclo-ligase